MANDDHVKRSGGEARGAGDASQKACLGENGNGASPQRTKAILLVDDEMIVLKVARRILERRGYEVFFTPRPLEAIELAREKCAGLDLAIIDLVMPGMGGRELLVKLKELCPGIKVLVASGYAADPTGDLTSLGCDGFISKPFDVRALEAIVLGAIGPPTTE